MKIIVFVDIEDSHKMSHSLTEISLIFFAP